MVWNIDSVWDTSSRHWFICRRLVALTVSNGVSNTCKPPPLDLTHCLPGLPQLLLYPVYGLSQSTQISWPGDPIKSVRCLIRCFQETPPRPPTVSSCAVCGASRPLRGYHRSVKAGRSHNKAKTRLECDIWMWWKHWQKLPVVHFWHAGSALSSVLLVYFGVCGLNCTLQVASVMGMRLWMVGRWKLELSIYIAQECGSGWLREDTTIVDSVDLYLLLTCIIRLHARFNETG